MNLYLERSFVSLHNQKLTTKKLRSDKMLRLKNFILVIIFSLLMVNITAAQNNEATINGFVYDASTGETLIGANVLLKKINRGVTTNVSGYYVIPQIDPDGYEVVVSYVGYKSFSTKVSLKANENKRLDVSLTPQDIVGREIVVSADSTRTGDKLFDQPVSKIELTPVELSKVPQVIEADLMRTLQTLPGIVPVSDFSSAIYVRGGTADQNLFMVDGTDIYNPEHAFGLFSTFNTDAIKKVEIYKGAFSAEYGGRLSSVINITNNDGNRNHFEGKASLSLLSLSTTLQTPLGSFGSLSGSIRRTYIDQTLAKWIKNVPDYYFVDGNMKAFFDLGESNKLSVSFFGSKDNLNFVLDKNRKESLGFDYYWGNQTGSVNWKTIFAPKLFGNFWLTGSYYFSDFNFSDVSYVESNIIRDVTLKGAVEYFYSDKFHFKSGFEFKNLSGSLKENFPGGRVDAVRHPRLFSTYVTTNWQPSNLWIVEAGLRYDYFESSIPFRNLDPRLTIKYRLDELSNLKFSTGIVHQYANRIPRMFFVSIWTTADEYVKASSSDHFVLGYQRALAEKIELEVEAYYKDYKNIYSYNPTFFTELSPTGYDENNLPIFSNSKGLFNRGDGNSYGIEFLLRKESGAITGWLSYSYSRTMYTVDNVNHENSFPPRHDRTHAVNLVVNMDLNNLFNELYGRQFVNPDKRWTLGVNFTYYSGQPITLPSSIYLSNSAPDWDINKNSIAVYPSTIDAFRLPYYSRLDFSLTYEIQYEGWSLSPYVQVFNVLNRKNVWFIQYKNEIKNNMVKQEINNVNMFPILPSIGITAKF